MQEAKTFNIHFDIPQTFEMNNVKSLSGIVGLYFIFTEATYIQYPFKTSRLLYIGMSEKMTNSISSRLTGHFDGKSKNIGLLNYRKVTPLHFCYFNYEVFKSTWKLRIEDLESYFILDFVKHFGVYPICNNRTGSEILRNDVAIQLNIDWKYFN
jgi:hypothetical protein